MKILTQSIVLIFIYLFHYFCSDIGNFQDRWLIDEFNRYEGDYDPGPSPLWYFILFLFRPISNLFGFNVLPIFLFLFLAFATYKVYKDMEKRIMPTAVSSYGWILTLINPYVTYAILQVCRQGFAISLILFGIHYINNNKIIYSSFFMVLCFFVHPSAFIFWLIFLFCFYFKKISKIFLKLKISISGILLIVGFFTSAFYIISRFKENNDIKSFIIDLATSRGALILSQSKVGDYQASFIYLLVAFIVYFFIFYNRKIFIRNNLDALIIIPNLYLISTINISFSFGIFALLTEELMRFAYYLIIPSLIIFIFSLNFSFRRSKYGFYLLLPSLIIWNVISFSRNL